jgi:two-component system response regulator RegX3
MKAKILIIEDEVEIAELISLYLKKDGLDSVHCETAEDALTIIENSDIDLIVLDINLPGMDGFEFLQKLRITKKIPVVIVSAREDDADMVLGLGIGADDYVTKPFSPKVLVARIRSNLRRYFNSAENADASQLTRRVIRFGEFIVDTDAYVVKKNEKRLSLSPREYEVLTYLIENSSIPKTPDDIYKTVWGNNYGDITTVAVHIQRIRKKIEKDPSRPEYIKTVHGFGYQFDGSKILTGGNVD